MLPLDDLFMNSFILCNKILQNLNLSLGASLSSVTWAGKKVEFLIDISILEIYYECNI